MLTSILTEGSAQVVLFEGWMLGFEPQKESVVTAVDPQVCLYFIGFFNGSGNKRFSGESYMGVISELWSYV